MERDNLTSFGRYVAQCLPKYVQKIQLTAGNELEVLITPQGVLPVLQFLKDHHTAQFASLADIAGLDVPSREFRFEVREQHSARSTRCGLILCYHFTDCLQSSVASLQLTYPCENLHR